MYQGCFYIQMVRQFQAPRFQMTIVIFHLLNQLHHITRFIKKIQSFPIDLRISPMIQKFAIISSPLIWKKLINQGF